MIVRRAFCVSTETFYKGFGLREKKFSSAATTAFYVYRAIFSGKEIFEKNCKFEFIRHFSHEFLNSDGTTFDKVVKTDSYVSRGTFFGKTLTET